mgnify:CR=1
FLNFFFNFWETDLLLGDKIILLNDKLDLQIPVTTDAVILPVPIKPSFISVFSTLNY